MKICQCQYYFCFSATLTCQCGYDVIIDDGIVLTPNRYTGNYDHPDLKRQLYRNMPDDLHYFTRVCSDKVLAQMQSLSRPPRVVLEASINGYFFLYKHLKRLNPNCLYIFTDKFPEMVRMYKALIGQLSPELNILFIADSSTDFPLRRGCVDLEISFLGKNEYLLHHENTFLDDAKKYYADDFCILGVYFAFEKNSQSLAQLHKKYPECSRNAYLIDYLVESCSNVPGKKFEYKLIGEIRESANDYSLACHVTGEPIKAYFFPLK